MTAAADEISASLRPRPPVLTGSVAWSHKESGINKRVISSRDCLKPLKREIHCLSDQVLQSAKGDGPYRHSNNCAKDVIQPGGLYVLEM